MPDPISYGLSGEPDPVEELMAECLLHAGEERERAVERVCAAHPELADEVRERLRLLDDLAVERSGDLDAFPEELGDFRLLDRLGGGGMGVVFRATQRSLGREVALKLIRPEQLYFSGARERFQREVLAIARLQHPNIVPIYTVGEEAGVPYFAMELVRGCTLAEVLSRLAERAPESLEPGELERCVLAVAREKGRVPADTEVEPGAFGKSWADACLGIARQVCEALEHAHGRGVVHRDVKPSNVALTIDGRALLLDFGLTSSAEADRLTRTGSQVGTLPYMSPEQLRDVAAVDRCTDVYALGVTLYELFTLQLPFRGDNLLETQRLIAGGTDAGSHPVRARNRAVPLDAETVCLKAMDRDPGRRYATAAAFERDLGNVQAQRPIEARPPGRLLRARRWSQRNPALATALGLGVLLLGGIPTALLVQQRGHNRALEEALARTETEARMSSEVAEFLLELFDAPDKIESMGEDLPARVILDRGVERIRTSLLDQPEVRARLLRKMGEIYARLSLLEESHQLLREALALYAAFLAERTLAGVEEGTVLAAGGLPPDLTDADLDLIAAYADLLHQDGLNLKSLGRFEESEVAFRAAHPLILAMEGPDSLTAGIVKCNWGVLHMDRRRHEIAEPLLREALRIYDVHAAAGALTTQQESEMSNVLNILGACLRAQGHPQEAEELLLRGLEIQRRTLPAGHYYIGSTWNNLALVSNSLGRRDEALERYGHALEISLAILGEENESVGVILLNIGRLQCDLARFDEGEQTLLRAISVFERITTPTNAHAVMATTSLAQLYAQIGRCEEALDLFIEVIPRQDAIYAVDEEVRWMSRTHFARCTWILGDEEEGALLMREAIAGAREHMGPEHRLTGQIEALLGPYLETTPDGR